MRGGKEVIWVGQQMPLKSRIMPKKSAEIMPLFALRIMPNYATTEELCRIMRQIADYAIGCRNYATFGAKKYAELRRRLRIMPDYAAPHELCEIMLLACIMPKMPPEFVAQPKW